MFIFLKHSLFLVLIINSHMAKAQCKICGKDFENKETDFCSRECTLAGAF